MAITDWPQFERPREKLLTQGASALSEAELLAIFLRTGIKGKSAVDLARDLLNRFSGLHRLLQATTEEIKTIPGLGRAKCAQLQAVLEIARRALREEIQRRDVMSSPQVVGDYLRLSLAHKTYEAFVVIFLDIQNRIIAIEELFKGTLTQASVYPREVVKCALKHNAAAVILAHNHPDGTSEPSDADKVLTQGLKQALSLIEVKVLDHFIVAKESVGSFTRLGLM